MARPQWTYPSNHNLGTIEERRQTTIPVLVFDNTDRSTLETKNFTNRVDSTILPIYSDEKFVWIKSTGLAQTPWIGEPPEYGKFYPSPVAQYYVFEFPRDKITIDGNHVPPAARKKTNTSVNGFYGVAIDGVPFKGVNSGRIVDFNGKKYTENNYIYPLQDFFTDGSGLIQSDRSFYYQSDPKLLYTKDPTRHSPVLGYAFDGNPIYGPYGFNVRFVGDWNAVYSFKAGDVVRKSLTENIFYVALHDNKNKPLTDTSVWRLATSTEPYQIMRTSYRITDDQRANHTLPDGTYIEDFIYEKGLGDLDKHNGRFVITPEYPDGTYAYFVTVDPDDVNLPRYPYIIGPTYYEEPLLPNGKFSFPGDIFLEVISGSLPPGMRIEGLSITGVPFEVASLKTFRFVLRATNLDGFSDRTYTITVNGPDYPIWKTPGSNITISNDLLYVDGLLGSNVVRLNSVNNILPKSIVTCITYPSSISPNTTVLHVNPIENTITLSKPLKNNIPFGNQLTFTLTQTSAEDLEVGTHGSRTTVVKELLDLNNATSGTRYLKMNSVIKIINESVVTCANYPNSIAPNTIVLGISTVNKTLTLNKPLIGPIPLGEEITFTYTAYHNNLFVLDNQYVNYQLNAIDSDTAAGVVLKYHIPPNGGILPPGLSLSKDGVISGFTETILANEQPDYNGNYDMQLYDKFGYDYGVRPFNGYDSFLYDTVTFDFSDATRSPRKLNRYYEFVVRVSDGALYTDRRFRIYVVGDTFFRADSTVLQVGTNTFTADVTPIRTPIWLTPSYLGRRRANNYITTLLDVYTSPYLSGDLGYVLDPINDDGSLSILPPGMVLDSISGEIYGDVPYQPAVTKTYKFTVRAINYDPNNSLYGYLKISKGSNKAGTYILSLDSVLDLQVYSLITPPAGSNYITPGTIITAVDMTNKTVTLNTPILNTIPAGQRFVFSYVVSSAKTFTIDIIGEVDSTIKFITPGDLGSIPANFVSELSVHAVTTVPNAVLNYTLVGGKLPPGLTLINDGTIQGKVNQYATSSNPGLTTFDGNTTSIDNFNTTVDRTYKFIVLAQDQFKFSAVTKIFNVSITTPDNLLYSNIYVKPFLNNTKRLELTDFFSNPDIFTYSLIYRPSDPQFGIQNELKMLLYSGIETKDASEYAAALGRSSKKRYRFGKVKKAIAKTPGTNNVVYEAVYVEIIDNMENSQGSVPKTIDTRFLNSSTPITVNQGKRDLWDSNQDGNSIENIAESNKDELGRIWMQDKILTADFGGQLVSDVGKSNVFGNSTSNIRSNISDLGTTERNYLPLWMRTPQTYSGISLEFTKGIVLCYALPGKGDTIVNNIKNLGIDFKSIDFTVDRIIIDSVKGQTGDKYIAFAAREIING